MTYTLSRTVNPALPRLAWAARADLTHGRVEAVTGPAVEAVDGWLVEGVWDGPFSRGDFHRSEAFFGSGLRVEGDALHLCASTASTDRLLYVRDGDALIASNSLVLMLASLGAGLDDAHDYWKDCLSIYKGFDVYDPAFRIDHPRLGHINQLFYGNLTAGPAGLERSLRHRLHELNTYDDYLGRVRGFLERIRANYGDPARQNPMGHYSTISGGYDSTAVAILAREQGVNRTFTGNRIDPPMKAIMPRDWDENAAPIARTLGLEVLPLAGERSAVGEDELYFLCTNYPKRHSGHWSEVGLISLANHVERHEAAAVVYTGYHGDLMWSTDTDDKYMGRFMRRQCLTGLNLSEMRLKAGFINLAVPFLMANQIEQVRAITRSAEMAPWRIGGDYDRPIPRRLIEAAGVARGSFAHDKKFLATRYYWPINRRLRQEFFRYLKEEHGIAPLKVVAEAAADSVPAQAVIRALGRQKTKRSELYLFGPEVDFFYLMNHWAMRKMVRRTRALLGRSLAA